MTERQARFVSEYVRSGNGTAAAKAAGYSPKYANREAHKLLGKAEIRAAIEERLERISGEQLAETQELMEFLTRVIRGQETTKVVTPRGAVVEIPAPIAERISAANLLLKIYGAYRQDLKVEISATERFISALEESEGS